MSWPRRSSPTLHTAAIAGGIILAACLIGMAVIDSTKPHPSYLNAGSVLWNK